MVIQRFLTCEGMFTRVYQYHIRLLMHFTGRKPLILPYYLYKILGKMADRVQERKDWVESSLFHFSLIKLLFLEELRKNNVTWESFLTSSMIAVESFKNHQSRTNTPSSVEKPITYFPEIYVKKRTREIEELVVSQQAKKKGKNLYFSQKVVETPSKPLSRSA